MTKHATMKLELEAGHREVTGSAVRKLRTTGILPAVLYGKGQEALNLQMPVKDFEKVFKQAGESTLVYVKVSGTTYPTIIKDVTYNPGTGALIHADFYKVRLDEKIKAMVPVVFVGISPAVADLGGIFVRNVNELEVEALPTDLPHEIEIDISSLKAFGDQLTIGDIKPHGWTLTAQPEEVVASVTEPISEEELKASLEAPTTDISAVEEIKKEVEEEVPAEEGSSTDSGQAASAPEAPASETK